LNAQKDRDADVEIAAQIDWADYVQSFQEKKRADMDENQLTKELERLGDELESQQASLDIPGAPAGWKPPTAGTDWKPNKAKVDKGEPPDFEYIDNPGQWPTFAFRPTFKKTNKKKKVVTAPAKAPAKAKRGGKGKGRNTAKQTSKPTAMEEDPVGKYLYHSLPTGATPLPFKNGERSIADYRFHYAGWYNEGTQFRDGATTDNLFPVERAGSLDGDVLEQLGLNAGRMLEEDGAPDALFFHQLILPIHHIDNDKVMTVPNDPRKGFYSNVARWTNLYAAGELGILGGGYGHEFQSVSPQEVMQWDGTVVMDGVLGGSHGSFLSRFDNRVGNEAFHKGIASTFTKSRWLEIKRTYKLCNNLLAKKKTDKDYDPAYKYDYIFDVIIHNVNALSLFAAKDLCLDETTFAFNGWGETGTGLFGLVMGKPGVTRGAQSVLVCDVDRIRPRAYLHRHKLYKKHFTLPGPNEVYLLWQKLERLLHGNEFRPHGIFRCKPHITCDNYFSGDCILKYALQEKFGLTMTCRRDRLPAKVPGKYLHKQKTTVNPRSKAARFLKPIFCQKNHGDDGQIQLTSFQSTSSCNIVHVNAVNECDLYAVAKEHGKGEQKRHWAIEMNQSRALYLSTYGKIDTIDALIKNCNMYYR